MDDDQVNGDGLLRGEVSIVTGGGRGIGRSIALALAAAGSKVCVAARSNHEVLAVVAEIKGRGGQAIGATVDVTDPTAVEKMVATTVAHLGHPTLLVNNAGSVGGLERIDSVDPLAWWRDIEVSLKGSFLCARAVVPGMVARGGGRIVNVSSEPGTVPAANVSSYACAKAGVFRLTDCLAAETTGQGLSVFAISPGLVRTALTEEALNSSGGKRWYGRLANPTWVEPEIGARLVVALATGKADELSGRFISIRDDLDDLIRHAAEIRQKDLYALRIRKL